MRQVLFYYHNATKAALYYNSDNMFWCNIDNILYILMYWTL